MEPFLHSPVGCHGVLSQALSHREQTQTTSEVVVSGVDKIAMAAGLGGLDHRWGAGLRGLDRRWGRGATGHSGVQTVAEATAIEPELILESQKLSDIW